MIPTFGTSLAVQFLRLHASSAGTWVPSLVGELRSCTLHGMAKITYIHIYIIYKIYIHMFNIYLIYLYAYIFCPSNVIIYSRFRNTASQFHNRYPWPSRMIHNLGTCFKISIHRIHPYISIKKSRNCQEDSGKYSGSNLLKNLHKGREFPSVHCFLI